MKLWLFSLIGIAMLARAAGAGNASRPSSPNPAGPAPQAAPSVVTPHVYVSLEPVPRGRDFQIAVVAKIASEFHINSHKPTDPYLIPTTLTPELPQGFELLDSIYPSGHGEKFVFSPNKPLDVYSGSVTLRLRIQAKGDAALGAMTIPMTLRYQACNQTSCLPPVKLPVDAKFDVAPEGTEARDMHMEIFATLRPLR
jgi:hypothetical protein